MKQTPKSIATIENDVASVETMPRRSRLAFSEELQIAAPAAMTQTVAEQPVEPPLVRIVRPADPYRPAPR